MNLLEVAGGRRLTFVLVLLAIASSVAFAVDHEERGRVVVTETETTILDVVEFEPGTATLCAHSLPTLDAVAATLLGNPSLKVIEVQSHTSGLGDSSANIVLSEQRAGAVVAYLLQQGVEPKRLVAQGYGDTQPIDPASPAKNERVSFLILERD